LYLAPGRALLDLGLGAGRDLRDEASHAAAIQEEGELERNRAQRRAKLGGPDARGLDALDEHQ
jgi:hypothetical protein